MERIELCEKPGKCVYVELDPKHLFLAAHCEGDVSRCGKYMPGARLSGSTVYVPARIVGELAARALEKLSKGDGIAWIGVLASISCTADHCVVDDGRNTVYTSRRKVVEWLQKICAKISAVL